MIHNSQRGEGALISSLAFISKNCMERIEEVEDDIMHHQHQHCIPIDRREQKKSSVE